MASTISAGDKVLDSRDIIARLEELESLQSDFAELQYELAEACPEFETMCKAPLGVQCDFIRERLGDEKADELESVGEHFEEYETLKKFANDAENASDWIYGCIFIHESCWTEYCRELVSDIGDLPHKLPHYIESAIDWDIVGKNLKADYSEYEFGGETYYARD